MTILKKFCCLLALAMVLAAGGVAVSGAALTEAVCYVEDTEQLSCLTTTPLYTVREGKLSEGLAELPEDVTAEYAGDAVYGVPAGAARGYAFRITLNQTAFREDGSPVTAEDVLAALGDHMEDFPWIANAEACLAGAERPAETVVSLNEAGFDTVADARAAGYTRFYVDLARFWGLEAGWESADDRQRIVDHAMPAKLSERYVTAAYLYRNYLADGQSLAYMQGEFVGVAQEKEALTMEDVGILKTGEYELTIVTGSPMTAKTLAARLAELHLEGEGSYGPYRIVSEDADEIRLERNEFWQGDRTGYPADVILCRPR